MIEALSRWTALAAGGWVVAVGVFMVARPRQALLVLAEMGRSLRLHVGEMVVRLLAGAAFVVAADRSRAPEILAIFGVFLIVSAVILLILPRRWHSTYSRWWAARISPTACRLTAPFAFILGGLLIWVFL